MATCSKSRGGTKPSAVGYQWRQRKAHQKMASFETVLSTAAKRSPLMTTSKHDPGFGDWVYRASSPPTERGRDARGRSPGASRTSLNLKVASRAAENLVSPRFSFVGVNGLF
jgi:hypothetical protein